MMFSPETIAKIPTFKAKKQAQWERVSGAIHGLQMASSGPQGTHFMLTCSTHDDAFYESIIYGQLPVIVWEQYGPALNPFYRDMADERKPHDKRLIDLSDEQIDQVLALWEQRQSAVALPFVLSVWGIDGRERIKV